MTAVSGSTWMVATLARYQTRVTVAAPGSGAWAILIGPDPRRWSVRFEDLDGSVNNAWAAPDGIQAFATPASASNLPLTVKFVDAPAQVTGRWWGVSPGGARIQITEELYVGD